MSVPTTPRPLVVLVPDDDGPEALAPYPHLQPLRYDVYRPPTEEQRNAPVIVLQSAPVAEAGAFMAGLAAVELVQTLNAGYDQWLDLLPAGAALANARGAHGGAVAEWVAAVLLAHYRDLAVFAERQAAGHWHRHQSESLSGKRIAVLGAGDLGTNVRRVLEPFGCAVTLVGRTGREGVLSLEDFWAVQGAQDAVVGVLPDSPETRGLVDADFLARLKDGAVVVNAGRGSLVDTDAMIEAAKSGRIHAILDVTDPEPLPDGHPLWATPGVTITPHVSGTTPGLWKRAWRIAAAQIDAFSRGQRPANLVVEGRLGRPLRPGGC